MSTDVNAASKQGDMGLHDDKADQSEFKGATLELDAASKDNVPEVDFRGQGAGMQRERPFSASMASRKSAASTASRTSLSTTVVQNDYSAKAFFCYRSTAFENAVEACQAMTKPELDGEIRGAWLLTEIDHWDAEREKIVVLTEYSLLIFKYDFIGLKLYDFRRVFLHMVKKMQVGDLVYPEKSLMPARGHGGVRIFWDQEEPGLLQKWNPFSRDYPYLTLAHHPLLYHEKERETVTFNVDDFLESFEHQVRQAIRAKNAEHTFTVEEAPIMIESYASVVSLIYNQSHLGFNRERGGVSY